MACFVVKDMFVFFGGGHLTNKAKGHCITKPKQCTMKDKSPGKAPENQWLGSIKFPDSFRGKKGLFFKGKLLPTGKLT